PHRNCGTVLRSFPSRASLFEVAERNSGEHRKREDLVERRILDRAETIAQIRQYLKNQPDNGDGVRWGRWLLANRSTRTISPFSSITVPQYIENRIKERTAESLAEAEQLATGNAELSRRVLEMRAIFERTNSPAALQREA